MKSRLANWLAALFACILSTGDIQGADLGSIDYSFRPRVDPIPGYINGLSPAWHNRVLVSGYFTLANGHSRPNLVLLEGDGAPAEDFIPKLHHYSSPNYTVRTSDGNIFVCGWLMDLAGDRFESSTDLANWEVLDTFLKGEEPVEFVDHAASGSRRFYRARVIFP